MGAEHERADIDRPGLIHPPPTEISVFGFWERWRHQMSGQMANQMADKPS